MRIETIYIAAYRYDLPFTRACIASIRHWYPDITIRLIKDYFYGSFDTREMEEAFNVGVFETDQRVFSWGFSKLEPLFQERKERYLVLDSDILFMGDVLSVLEAYDEDFIVDEEAVTDAFVKSHYFDLEKLKALDPGFKFPDYAFNTGQIVGTSGIFKRDDFRGLVDWVPGMPPRINAEDTFKLGEQGLMNYFLMKEAALGSISLRRLDFMKVGDFSGEVDLKKIEAKEGYPFLMHWCGLRRGRFDQMVNGHLWDYFSEKYYKRVPFGKVKQWMRPRAFWAYQEGKGLVKKFIR